MDARHLPRPGSALEVFVAFLRLGLTSFGGPVAHLGYFREALITRKRWASEAEYAELISLCHALPGPTSSQIGMTLGLRRAGWRGLIAAWVGFTMPSAILLIGFGLGLQWFDVDTGAGWVLGLKAGAVAVVMHAVIGMARSLILDLQRAAIGIGALILMLVVPGVRGQLLVLASAALIGMLLLNKKLPVEPRSAQTRGPQFSTRSTRRGAVSALVTLAALLIAMPIAGALWPTNHAVQQTQGYFQTGSLVFGGGHVVLPLLEAQTVGAGLVTEDVFLAGYGAAQAIPGPLFTFAAFLGVVSDTQIPPVWNGMLALVTIFLPSALLILGILPFWDGLQRTPKLRSALAGVNAGVVGLLAAACYSPVITTGITSLPAGAIALAGLMALWLWRRPAWHVIIAAALLGALLM